MADKNHHAHILLTTRKAELDQDHNLVLKDKADIELSNAKRKSLGMGTSQEEIKQIRATWANLANHALEYAGYRERIDHPAMPIRVISYKPLSMRAVKSPRCVERA